nr:hypothetical protein [uncultured Marvinbryantia sp.]
MGRLTNVLKGQLFQYSTNRNMRNERVKKEIYNNFQKIKCLNNENIFEKEFSDIFESKVTREYTSANFVPTKIENLRKYVTVGYSGNFLYDFRWMVYCIKQNSNLINIFVQNRKEIDRLILFGKYKEALDILEETERRCGNSFWSCEYRIFLNKQLEVNVEDIWKDIKGLPGFILECFNFKNFDNISFDDYRYVLEKKLKVLAEESDIDLYLKYIVIRRQIDITEENVMRIIKYALDDSIIDQYILVLDICQMMVGKQTNNETYCIIKKYINQLKQIEDDSLMALRFSYEDIDKRNNYTIKEGLLEAKNNFIAGKIELSYKQALEVLRKAPYNIEALNLYVESKTLLSNKDEYFVDTPLGMLLISLEDVYALKDEREQNLERILRFINILSKSSWAVAVDKSILGRIHQIGSEKEKKEKSIVFAQYLDIETVCHNLKKEESLDFIEKYLDVDNAYIRFRKLVVEQKFDEARALCGLEILKDLMIICDRTNDVKHIKYKVANICGNNAIMCALNARCFFGRLDLETDYEIGLEVATDLIVNNKQAIWFLPVESYIKHIEYADLRLDTIAVPILYYVYYYYMRRDKKDNLAIRCDDFLFENKVDLPSHMKDYNKCTEAKLIYFLRYVCTTDILNSAICEFETSKQLEEERIDICQLLCILDKSHEDVYEEEIREITQRLMINDELTIIEENRIHVNVDGIKKRIIEDYKYDYLSYQISVDERFKKYQRLLDIVKEIGKSEGKNRIVFLDEETTRPENLLNSIVTNIRDAFVSSDEYGLDGYLSLNIRHGTLADELRSPLVNAKLLVSYNTQTGMYELDTRWLTLVKNIEERNDIVKAIVNFYLETEKIINDLKNIYIQIQTEKKESEGCFDYCLTETDFLTISMINQEVLDFEEFLDIVFDYLWKRTEENLVSMKAKIKGEIATRYTDAFKNLRANLEDIEPKVKIRELNRKINEAETDMQNVLDKICFWFQRSEESKHADFDLEFVFLMGLQTIHNMHPECKFIPKPIKSSSSDKKIKGKYLKNFANIFYNIFDNIYQNAQRDDECVKFEYLLGYKEGNIHILVQNPYDCSGDLKEETEKINTAKDLIESGKYLSKIKGEGGTGIPKIYKMILVDLGAKPEMNFGFIKKKNKFYIELKFRRE